MNKIKALITTLILGSSAAAFAQTSTVYSYSPGAPAPTATVVVNARAPMPAPQPAPQAQWQHGPRQQRWSTLAASAKINGTKEYIRVGAQAGKFDELKLQMISGKTQIKLVQINFANGGSQLVKLNTTLDRSNPTATIDLQGQNRAIANITVYGSSGRNAAYQILAS